MVQDLACAKSLLHKVTLTVSCPWCCLFSRTFVIYVSVHLFFISITRMGSKKKGIQTMRSDHQSMHPLSLITRPLMYSFYISLISKCVLIVYNDYKQNQVNFLTRCQGFRNYDSLGYVFLIITQIFIKFYLYHKFL